MRKLIIRLLFGGDALALRTFELVEKRRAAFKLNEERQELRDELQEVHEKLLHKGNEIDDAKAGYFEARKLVEAAYDLNI